MDIQHILNNGQQQQPKLADQMEVEDSYRLQKISVQIIAAEHQLTYPECVIEIDQSCISVVVPSGGEQQKVVNLMFSNISSVGIQDDKIMVFLQGQQQEDDNCYNGGQQQDNDNPPPMPEILSLISQSQTGTFNLQGNFTLSLSFTHYPQQKKTQTHELMIGYLKSEQEQQEQNFMDEMISADQINEDGTINKFNQQENQNDSDQDQDDDEEQKNIDEEK